MSWHPRAVDGRDGPNSSARPGRAPAQPAQPVPPVPAAAGPRPTGPASDCPYTGLSHLADRFSDTPPNMPGVVTVSTRWTLKNVPDPAGQSALRRAGAELRRQGWDVTENATADRRTTLRTVPPGGGATLYARARPGGRLAVSAAAECARCPENTPAGPDGNPELPPQRLPDGLRR